MARRARGTTLNSAGLALLVTAWSALALAAGSASNEATDPGGGALTLQASGALTVTAIPPAVSAASAAIAPLAVAAAASTAFTYDVLPTLGAGDSGIDRLTLTAPAGYSALSVTGVQVGGAALAANCPSPGAGEYCATVAGQTLTVALGSKVTTDATALQLAFTAIPPATLASAAFSGTVADSATSYPAQAVAAGSADGLTVAVLPSVAFAAASSAGDEGLTPAQIAVTLTPASSQSVTVDYALDAAGTATGGGEDYTLAAGTLSFAPGETSASIALAVVDDAALEGDETVVLVLSNPGNAVLGATGQHVYTIQDNDNPNAVTALSAEIDPTEVVAGQSAQHFAMDLLPQIGPADSGFDRITLTAPAGYGALAATALRAAGTPLAANCPSPGAGEYCATASGAELNLVLGSRHTASANVHLAFTAATPATAGSGDFAVTVDDAATPVAAQAASAGDADGDTLDANSLTVAVVYAVDPDASLVVAEPDIVVVDGKAAATLGATLIDTQGGRVAGKTVRFSSDRGTLDTLTQPAAATDSNGEAAGAIRSTTPGVVSVSAEDVTDGIVLTARATVYFTQGQVLKISKTANKNEVTVGEVVTYRVDIKNTTGEDVVQVRLLDRLPPNFKYLAGSARLNGAPLADPEGVQRRSFAIGTVPALVDTNGNGEADPGEAGYVSLTYQLVVGAGATPRDYLNQAVAVDVCEGCEISNSADAKVTVALDPLFDLGTILGKVYLDRNRNRRQDPGEPGVAGAMVVLDEGTYVLTDEHGRYHFPAVRPGQRLLKINARALAPGAEITSGETVVVSVTPGLLAKANFGVIYEHDELRAGGRPARYGLAAEAAGTEKPVSVFGSTETYTLLVNGFAVDLPAGAIRMQSESLDPVVHIDSDGLKAPVRFATRWHGSGVEVARWRLNIYSPDEVLIRALAGEGVPPPVIQWDGRDRRGGLVIGGWVYQYQLVLELADGSRVYSARRLLGVNRSSAIALNLTGDAFDFGSARLSEGAKAALRQTAELMQRYPREQVVVEGHADRLGGRQANLRISEQRARMAAAYLTEVLGVPRARVIVRWFGPDRPVASNSTEEGRALNRRVEIRGSVGKVDRAQLLDHYRTGPAVQLDGAAVAVERSGLFNAELPPGKKRLHLAMTGVQGRGVETTLPVPALELDLRPVHLPLGARDNEFGYFALNSAALAAAAPDQVVMGYRLHGRTDPGNGVYLDDVPVAVADDGRFSLDLKLRRGGNLFTLMVRGAHGYTRFIDLRVVVRERDDEGGLLLMTTPRPLLEVKLPPEGVPLTTPLLVLSGATDPGGKVDINGQPVAVQGDGRFTHTVSLQKGRNHLMIEAVDGDGYRSRIEREVEVKDTQLFLLAFADGKFGQLKGKGYLAGAGMERASEFYAEGRLAYYLKGVIAGKYLITSALDTGSGEPGRLFQDLDSTGQDRLLTNLDPDKLYPVYGDASTLVYDTESQGKFYLAVESEEINALVGNFALSLADTELAAYRRTVYGARLHYRSLARAADGRADTEVLVFGAEARQAPVRDELRATGGSLYYLSHRDVIEGSEQISIVVRDKNTGLPRSRRSLRRNEDYEIKYAEGRLLFSGPVASVETDDQLVDEDLLGGNPVYIEVDYETRVDFFEKSAYGARARKALGEHVTLGATAVQDELAAGEYQLQGVDGELRLGPGTRVTAEVAQSRGTAGEVFVSEDGGLSFTQRPAAAEDSGRAWKLGLEADAGRWFGQPGRLRLGGYIKRLEEGFSASGSSPEAATEKSGVHARLKMTGTDTLRARHDRSERLAATESGSETSSTVQWEHRGGRWRATGEVQSRSSTSGPGRTTAAAGLERQFSERLSASLEHQATLNGPDNDQSTVGARYRLSERWRLGAKATRGSRGAGGELGVAFDADGSRFYLTERLLQDRQGRDSLTTIAGGATPINRRGKVYSEYQWEQAADGDRSTSLLGADQSWRLAEGLRFQLGAELGSRGGPAGDSKHYSLAGRLSYAAPRGLKARSHNELRREWGAQSHKQFLTSNHLEIKLNPDYTVLVKLRYSLTRDLRSGATAAEFNEHSIGLAYRPVAHDRFNALARYTRLSDQRPQNLEGVEAQTVRMDVASLEWSWQLTPRLEWVDKLAGRIREEASAAYPAITTTTWLSLNRLNVEIRPRIDLGLEYRLLRQQEAKDQRQGWLTEVAWKAMDHLRLGGGYNFTDFSDNEFSDNEYSVQGWFIRLQGTY